MKIIDDNKLKDFFINKFNINDIFDSPINEFSELVEFKRYEYICMEGDTLNYMYFVVFGKSKTYTTLENGKRLLLNFFEDFGIIGDLEYITKAPCNLSVETLTKTSCVRISFDKIRELFDNNSIFLRSMAKNLAKSLIISNKNSSKNLLYPLKNRLANYIYFSAMDGIFKENLTELSELLATSYRHLNRTIFELCLSGILEKKKNNYIVKDMIKLEELANIMTGSYIKK